MEGFVQRREEPVEPLRRARLVADQADEAGPPEGRVQPPLRVRGGGHDLRERLLHRLGGGLVHPQPRPGDAVVPPGPRICLRRCLHHRVDAADRCGGQGLRAPGEREPRVELVRRFRRPHIVEREDRRVRDIRRERLRAEALADLSPRSHLAHHPRHALLQGVALDGARHRRLLEAARLVHCPPLPRHVHLRRLHRPGRVPAPRRSRSQRREPAGVPAVFRRLGRDDLHVVCLDHRGHRLGHRCPIPLRGQPDDDCNVLGIRGVCGALHAQHRHRGLR
mmetsp:Transcript_118239/g.331145  ORF Transcript_118239/g.331145 Transcript_118239/m.331145 type:complete len:278 (-) Transcript_118239:529-1362(-)